MTTLTACRKHIKAAKLVDTQTLYIVHTDGFVDRRGIDRGYTVLDSSMLLESSSSARIVEFTNINGTISNTGGNMKQRKNLNCYDLYWAPEGRKIATVEAKDARSARRKAPKSYRRYLGEIWVEMVGMTFGIENWEATGQETK